jgi:ribosomal protein S18 acetylase RimI-like enzyme
VTPAIHPARPEWVPELARIHAESLPDDFLPSLGRGFLERVYYPAALASAHAATLVAVDDAGRPLGFVTAAHDSAAFSRDVVAGRAATLAAYALRAALRDPLHLRRSAAVAWTALFGRPDPLPGEIVFIAVDARTRGGGVGKRLVAAAAEHVRARGLRAFRTKTLAANAGVIGMYASLGWRVRDRFRLIGREYVTLVSPELSG